MDAVLDNVYHKQVPLNVYICVWRLLCNRLPTKNNLVRRYIISQEAHYCVSVIKLNQLITYSFTVHYSVLSTAS